MKDLSRRDFLKIAGASSAALGAIPLDLPIRTRQSRSPERPEGAEKPLINDLDRPLQFSTDVLVVGGGMAGVFAAIKAHDRGAGVCVVDKGWIGRSGQTPFARDIFVYDSKRTSFSKKELLDKMAEVSEGIFNPVYMEMLLDDSLPRYEELREWGFFDTICFGPCLRRQIETRNIPLGKVEMVPRSMYLIFSRGTWCMQFDKIQSGI
ncbi:MAG: FAD-binding protein [Oligoflexales bacterium]|nr:FAD-binding protein [Oligoflexales bacterium]